jgi:beta-glucosidase/6-phospho-beta-glucosidase/beta-galactosidase
MKKSKDFKQRIAKKKFQPLKPIKMSEVEREMFRRHDYIGLEYYHCDQIRRKRKKTPQQMKRLVEHEKEEAQIQSDPNGAA